MVNFNRAVLSGTLTETPVFKGTFYGKPYYNGKILISNKSRIPDVIDVVFSGNEGMSLYSGMHIRASGKYTTRVTDMEDGSRNTSLYVLANTFYEYDGNDYSQVIIEGMLSARPEAVKMQNGTNILKMILSVEKRKGTDFIPIDVYNPGKNLENLDPGEKLFVKGHINCRQLMGRNEIYKKSCLFATVVDELENFTERSSNKTNRIILTKEREDRFRFIDDFLEKKGVITL